MSLSRAREEGDGIEAAARHERYALLTQAAERRGIRYLAFAHTQNDQVETILFRLLRGTGIRGLAGMSRARSLTPTLSLIRPMLACTRDEILAYLSEKGAILLHRSEQYGLSVHTQSTAERTAASPA